ncbi:DUF4142 domain-containing protein [Pedobacter polaris]|uniref:DUF4142 domain-containing protein n=1 Tax=Pedobacter polaris TaxID=2571273 RepID=A0A4V5NZX8_9SPHI|nr:DUF4142 domain-containing protein [Pedobacter polaris]TKC10442.1 DUF4142 domain-containing protein [Pedobacter polaris]
MKNPFLYLIILVLAACGSNEQKDSTSTKDSSASQPDTLLVKTDDATKLDSNDVSFFEHAAYGGMVEVESSSKILVTTEDSAIKTFAQMMVNDHGDANRKLSALAQSKGYVLPSALPNSKIELINKMDSFKDEGRNEYYLQLMINEHKTAIDLFALAERSADKQISQFASGLLPKLKHHYRLVMQIDTAFQAPKANQGDDPLKLSDRKAH